MKHLITIISLIVFLFQINSIFAQQQHLSSGNKKALKYYQSAETAYRQKEFSMAVESLQKAIKKDPQFIEAWLLLGDTYTELFQKEEAVSAYKEALRINPDFLPQVYFFLGKLEYELGRYQEAMQHFKKMLAFREITSDYRKRGEVAVAKAGFALGEVQNPTGAFLHNLSDSINTSADEYINFVNETSDKLILTRKVPNKNKYREVRLFDEGFFQSESVNNEWLRPQPLALLWKENLNLGGMSISVDGRKMYFTGCHWPNSYGSCDLYVSFRKGKTWQAPSNLGAFVNSQWWDSQPVISANGKQLFFSSKRSGGKGGADIWMSIKLSNGKWSQPLNLGDSINTAGDEMAPFLHADGKTLYFSSNGRKGLGGFDVFVSRKDLTGQWSMGKNIGYPANTNANEINIFISLDGNRAWISSDREGGMGGFDIYRFRTYPQIKPGKVLFMKGVVQDKNNRKFLEAKIELTNLLNNRIENLATSDPITGEFLMVLHPGINYALSIFKKGYLFYSENIDLKQADTLNDVTQFVELVPLKQGEQMTLNNVFFDFNSAKLKASSATELNKLIEMLKENTGLCLLISGHTDNIGDATYNQRLSEERALAVYNYLRSAGIDADRLNYKGYGDTMPIESNASESGRMKNRRTEITVL